MDQIERWHIHFESAENHLKECGRAKERWEYAEVWRHAAVLEHCAQELQVWATQMEKDMQAVEKSAPPQ